MNECERILNKGIISKQFFDEEFRCDFYIDRNRKKIWAIEIDLLMELDNICKRHNLRYWAICGTLLGAVRHGGFIPWDDDIDVAMPRNDYEKLINIAENELSSPYFLQTPKSDKGYYYSFIKLRNSNTTGMKIFLRDAPFNLGMSIDIFPLDNACMDDYGNRYMRIKELCIDLSNYMRCTLKNPTENELRRIHSFSGRKPEESLEEIQRLSTMYNLNNSDYVGLNSITVYPCLSLVYKSEDFNSTKYVDFENIIAIPIPGGQTECSKQHMETI